LPYLQIGHFFILSRNSWQQELQIHKCLQGKIITLGLSDKQIAQFYPSFLLIITII